MENKYLAMVMARLSLGFIFLWPFLDKLLGLGYSTCALKDDAGIKIGTDFLCEKAWLMGGSPTQGFLSRVNGPIDFLNSFFNGIAGHPLTNTLFMLGLLGIGIALLFGAGMRLAAWSGSIMLVAMWVAEWGTFTTNPFMDDHLIYSMALFVLYFVGAGDHFGLGTWWKGTEIVKKYPWLA